MCGEQVLARVRVPFTLRVCVRSDAHDCMNRSKQMSVWKRICYGLLASMNTFISGCQVGSGK